MNTVPLTPQATHGYPINRDLLLVRRAERRARPRFARSRAFAARLRRGRQR
jgi:hypothetical protein